MNKREERVINAFINCVKSGEFSLDYATTLIESNDKYGYLSEAAKDTFYNACAAMEETTVEIPEIEIEMEGETPIFDEGVV